MASVLKKEEADKIALGYAPRKFPQAITDTARQFVSYQSAQEQPNFRIDRLVAGQTGVAELERLSIEKQVEHLALEKFKEIQEAAYKEAYELGKDDGRERAYGEYSAEFQEKLSRLEEVLNSIGTLKNDLVTFNEAHLIRLVFQVASRLAMDEIRERPDVIIGIMKNAIESAQTEENITVHVSKEDFAFINSIRERLGKEGEILKKIHLEESETVHPGGCIIETNYGSVDATVERRIEKLWAALEEKLPKVKDRVGDE